MLVKNVYFWIETAVFIALLAVVTVKVLPPALTTLANNQTQIKTLNSQIAQEKQFTASLTALSKNQDQLDSLANLGVEALPANPDGEELQLQLDGLLASLGMSAATATVPLSTTAAPAPGAAADAAGGANQLAITVSGSFDYAKAQALITGLKTLIRWNKITAFDISQNGTTSQISFGFNVFYKPGAPKTFSGTSNLLGQAQSLFAAYHSYTTRPNINTEGTYGKSNPFSAP